MPASGFKEAERFSDTITQKDRPVDGVPKTAADFFQEPGLNVEGGILWQFTGRTLYEPQAFSFDFKLAETFGKISLRVVGEAELSHAHAASGIRALSMGKRMLGAEMAT